MLFKYEAIDNAGSKKEGNIDAINEAVAISSLQKRGFIIVSIVSANKKSLMNYEIELFQRVSNKDIVILSRQIATLFEAQVSALRIFRLLGEENENPMLQKRLTIIADDLQAGSTISGALAKHENMFSSFFVNMVRTGEEAGKLEDIFNSMADYLDRTYELTTKARNALIYPAFVIFTFIAVMTLMLVMVIPKLSAILESAGTEVPLYTKAVIRISEFIVSYGIWFLVGLIIAASLGVHYFRTKEGAYVLGKFKLKIPYLGDLYKKLYLSRISDNLSTMLQSGIPMVQAIKLTGDVVGNKVYQEILIQVSEEVKAGSAVSSAFQKHEEIPGIIVQMIKVGEETGELHKILKTMATFYRREVNNAVDTLIGLIEPAMILMLGVGVGTLLASVLIPIYNISESF